MSIESSLQFGRAVVEDLPAVVELCMEVEAQHEAYMPLRWERRPNLSEGFLRWLTRRIDDPRMLILVARDDAAPTPVVGMILITIETEIPIYTYAEYAYVQDMAVRESHRRQGIAQRLLADASEWCLGHHGLTQLRLLVASHNPTARAAFEKAGFLPTYNELILPLKRPSSR